MCVFKSPPQLPITPPTVSTPAPSKTSADVQAEAEAARLKDPLSVLGFASTILTGGLGATTKPKVKGVVLGGG